MKRIDRDTIGGLLLMAAGFGFALIGRGYGLGTMGLPGSGFMPVVLGLLLGGLGAMILISGLAQRRGADSDEPFGGPDRRGTAAIVLSFTAFILFAEWAGMIVATFAVVFIAAIGDRSNRPREAVLLAAAVTAICVLVFYYGLQVRLPLWPGES